MKSRFPIACIAFFLFFSTACVAGGTTPFTPPVENDRLALQTITDFLAALHAGDYEKAVSLYGGTYETMIDHNPDVSPSAHATLFQNACTINGAQCLQAKSIVLDEKVSNAKFIYRVEFQNEDGSLFVFGPCCGDNDPNTQSQSSFHFEVIQNNEGKFLVMDMVPYMP